MKGQYLGYYQGSVEGRLMINIDEVDDHFEGVVYVNPKSRSFPSSVGYFSTKDKSNKHSVIANVYPIDPRNGFQSNWDSIKSLYGSDISHSNIANTSIELKENKLFVESLTDVGATLTSVLEKPAEEDESKIEGKEISWSEFKNEISQISKSKFLFRGQKKPWRLRTSFHRCGRYRISEFIGKDVRQLHQRLSAITSHYFDLAVPDQNGSFLNLLQHHGYPTPLLDWSYSPYVAAFFAFRGWPISYKDNEKVRIYVFNNDDWQKIYQQHQTLDPPFPHLSVMEFISIDNPRLVPQQAVTTVSNIDDIEAYVIECEAATSQKYLTAFDIPAKERDIAMKELRFMGITAGSMFPSIDGVCEELKERNFDR